MARKKTPFIKQAKLKKGALRNTVRQRYGKKGFDSKGNIKKNILVKMSKEKHKRTGRTTTTARRARLAITLRSFKRRK